MQWSFDRGFLQYVNILEQERLERLADKLAHAYAEKGNWNFLQDTPGKMPQLIMKILSELTPQVEGSNPSDMRQDPVQTSEPMRYRGFYRLQRRILLLDAQRNPIFGHTEATEIDNFKAINHQDQVVDFLGLLPHKVLSDAHQHRFVSRQKLVLALVAGVMLVVAWGSRIPWRAVLSGPLRNSSRLPTCWLPGGMIFACPLPRLRPKKTPHCDVARKRPGTYGPGVQAAQFFGCQPGANFWPHANYGPDLP